MDSRLFIREGNTLRENPMYVRLWHDEARMPFVLRVTRTAAELEHLRHRLRTRRLHTWRHVQRLLKATRDTIGPVFHSVHDDCVTTWSIATNDSDEVSVSRQASEVPKVWLACSTSDHAVVKYGYFWNVGTRLGRIENALEELLLRATECAASGHPRGSSGQVRFDLNGRAYWYTYFVDYGPKAHRLNWPDNELLVLGDVCVGDVKGG